MPLERKVWTGILVRINLVKFKIIFNHFKRINFKRKKEKSRSQWESSWIVPLSERTAYTVSLLPAHIAKHTGERNKKQKAVNKICVKLCHEWGSNLAVWSLKSAALILDVGRQHVPAGRICRERQTGVSMLILDGPLNIDRASNKAFPRLSNSNFL